ncbi:ETS domain-containing protein Elk-3-like isoform X1 [Lates japonicus]|uniref:ETS domain-containing protein Elk-3-like isoform X1 n=1 Tax=Lates japonicus TaxID=270547 RepID=A0AAD3NHX7_LATJO|nr:ETS domain-containing protein Elk-3-like isoform X1 [Lates japonicus]
MKGTGTPPDGNTAPEEVRRFSVCASRLPALRREREKLRIRFQRAAAAAAAWSPNTTHTPRFKTQTHTPRTGETDRGTAMSSSMFPSIYNFLK